MPDKWCKEHKTLWFKKGNMKGYAHPVLDENGEPEKDENGKPVWCNEPKHETTEQPPQKEAIPQMTKEDWGEKDRITRKSIERQKSLELAVEIAKLLGAEKVTTEKILATARVFENYLESGKMSEKSKLVEEAEKLGTKIDK